MSIREKLFKQHNIGHVWGRFALAGSQIAIFVSGYTFLMVSFNAYNPIYVFMAQNFGYELDFWVYLGIVFVPIILAYIVAWKFLVRSFYLSWADQFWQQSGDVVEKINEISEQNKKILEKLIES
jgi:hypothetical protein